MPGTLYVVATPIGNLEDVTLRALRILREVSLIAAEDTRRTARLLQHYSISTRTTSLHEHNERVENAGAHRPAAGRRIDRARVGRRHAGGLGSRAAHLVAAAHAAGIRVEPIPGASAAHGGPVCLRACWNAEFVFAGFPPNRSKARKKWLAGLAAEPRGRSFFTRPPPNPADARGHLRRISATDVIAVGRELTKAHEELVVRPISEHLELLYEPNVASSRSLFLAKDQMMQLTIEPLWTLTRLPLNFGRLTDKWARVAAGGARTLAARYDVPAREVFALLERAKKSGQLT